MKTCRLMVLAFITFFLSACAQPMSSAAKGTLAGGAIGAGTGAIVGSVIGKPGPAIAIGAGLGALSGALVGNSMDSQDVERERLEEQQMRQQQELERQRREIEEMRRQQRYDDLYRHY